MDELVGRDAELATIRSLLDARSGALAIAGEPGIGKTSLRRAAVDAADGYHVDARPGRPTSGSRRSPRA